MPDPGDELQRAADALSAEIASACYSYEAVATPVTDVVGNLIAMSTYFSDSASLRPWPDGVGGFEITQVGEPLTIEWYFNHVHGTWTTVVNGEVQYQELPRPAATVTVSEGIGVHLATINEVESQDRGRLAFGGCTCEHLDWEHHRNGCEVDECPCTGGWRTGWSS